MIHTAITWSSYSTAQACRRAYWYRYCEGLESVEQHTSDALQIGDAVHRLCGGESAVPDLPEHLRPLVAAMVFAWVSRYGETQVGPEREIEAWVHDEIEIGDENVGVAIVTIGAHCDEIRTTPDGPVVVERKTASHLDVNYFARLALDQQIALQAYLAGTTTVIYDVIQRSTIKQTKGETREEYVERKRALARRNQSGTSTSKRRMPEPDHEYQARLLAWYGYHPEALQRCTITVDRARQISAVHQIVSLAHHLRFAQLEVLVCNEGDEWADRLDENFPQSTQRCFDWGRRCEFFDLCVSGDSTILKSTLYQIRTQREGDPPTNATEET